MAGSLQQQEGNQARALDRLRLVLGDAQDALGPNTDQANPLTAIENPKEGSEPLSDIEIAQFQWLLNQKNQKALKLSILFERYKTLSTSLKTAQQYLSSKLTEEGIEIEDELIGLGVNRNSLIFFFKQYQCAADVWHSVPRLGYITNEQSLRTWLQSHNSHPWTRDPITQPSPYILNKERYVTRYRYHALTAEIVRFRSFEKGRRKYEKYY